MTAPAALTRAFADQMAQLVPEARRIGIAVSGGGDSMALLHLASGWGAARGVSIHAATVDHGLRAEAAAEQAHVAASCAALDLPHRPLRWTGWDGQGNLQASAREARIALLADWARAEALDAVCLGHTQDDQAETLLLRLMRGSGVDGLAAMSARRQRAGVLWLRPLLDQQRETLRDYLRAERVAWCEDPSNTDERFDRVRVRRAIDMLDLDTARLAQTADAMRRAQDALGQRAAEVVTAGHVRFDWGEVLMDHARLAALDAETRLRLLAEAVRWVSGTAYRPRLSSLETTWARLAEGPATLQGCLFTPERADLRISREVSAVADLRGPIAEPWDGRWQFAWPENSAPRPAAEVRSLGAEGLKQVGRPPDGPPFASLCATPAIWQDDRVLAVPRLKWGLSTRIDTQPDPSSFISSLIPH
ncbi:tRNA lysidine(34) synthetase TilS [Dinoroseobacter sp. S76]|uniref:tRNA lysidine(34) synthetase TilS n=1 Tax=Dinoroseobacter sp. S76 TaxID=3415124 RepID=UPI003C7EBD36